MSLDMETFNIESAATGNNLRTFLSRWPYQSPGRGVSATFHSWVLGGTLLLLLVAAAMFGIVQVVPHRHKQAVVKNEDIVGAAMDSELLQLPGAALRQELQDGHLEKLGRKVKLDPTLEVIDGTDVVWQIPSKPSAAVFFAHGCGQAATMFWDPTPNCSRCSGMPEDRALTQAALKRSFAVIAIKSRGSCWEARWPPESSRDVATVSQIIAKWQKEHHLEELPLSALGASSGGYFVTVLAHKVKFHALAVYISSGVRKAFLTDMKEGGKYPPTLFVHMPKDKQTGAAVQKALELLQQRGGQVAALGCEELPLTPFFFTERIVGLNKTVSEKIFGTLKVGGFLDVKGYLTRNPRQSDWLKALEKHSVLPKAANGKLQWEKHISEELNLAFASHELTSLKAPETFDWFKNRCWARGRYRHRRCRTYRDPVIAK